MAPPSNLDPEVAQTIAEKLFTPPCIRCDGPDHGVINHKTTSPKTLIGSVWKNLNPNQQKQAWILVGRLKQEELKRRKEKADEDAAAAVAAGSSAMGSSTANPPTANPSTAGPSTAGPSTAGPSTAGPSIAGQGQFQSDDAIIAPTGFAAPNPQGGNPYTNLQTSSLENIRDRMLQEPIDTTMPAPNAAPNTTSDRPGNVCDPTTDITKLPLLLPKPPRFAMRKDFATTTSSVLTNHFEVDWVPGTKFYKYEVMGIPAGMSKRQSKSIMQTVILAWDFLRDNQDFFTTDNLQTIVSWKDLHAQIQAPRKNVLDYVAWTPQPLADGDRPLHLDFKYHGRLNMERLEEFVTPHRELNNAKLPGFDFNPLVTCLNDVISKSLSAEVFKTSPHRFYFKNSHESLGDSTSLCIMRGYDYTIKPAMGKVLLNVNIATSAFFQPITVAEFLADRSTFTEYEVEKRIKGLRVYIDPDRKRVDDAEEQEHVDNLNMPQNRIKTIKSFGSPIGNRSNARLRFRKWVDQNGQSVLATQETHVVDHMREVFGNAHSFDAKLKAVNVGSEAEPSWYPQEFLRIVPYQMYNNLLPDKLVDAMLRVACKTPENVRACIESEGLKGLGVVQSRGIQKFEKCKVLTINPSMLQIPSTRMAPVYVVYANGKVQTPRMDDKAQWNLADKVKFLETPQNTQGLKYYMLVGQGVHDDTVRTYQDVINAKLIEHGVGSGATCLASSQLPRYTKEVPDETDPAKKRMKTIAKTHEDLKTEIETAIDLCKKEKSQGELVILVLDKPQIPVYSAFKDVSDRIVGLQSLCITQAKNKHKSSNDNSLGQYISNVMMKINLKRTGCNHSSADDDKGQVRLRRTLLGIAPKRSTIILGADVTHPGSSSLIGCPSIATLVGSIDFDGGKFLGSMRLQSRSKKEVIGKEEMEAMAIERFTAWQNANAHFAEPPNILYYRDGVSTGQYDDIVTHEVSAIKQAWEKVFNSNPKNTPRTAVKLTAVVAVKRHHTRFFPVGQDKHKNGNCKAGTLVDRAVVSPFFSEFYLQSHHALQGTAKPTRYFVVENGLGWTDTELQKFTHKLCFTYVRATLSVSYAPPCYYADRLCERGRQYLRDWFTPNYTSDHYQQYVADKNFIEDQHNNGLALAIAALPPNPPPAGRRRARKTEQQVDLERRFKSRANEDIEALVGGQAQAYLDQMRAGGPGPWAENLDGTMFWM